MTLALVTLVLKIMTLATLALYDPCDSVLMTAALVTLVLMTLALVTLVLMTLATLALMTLATPSLCPWLLRPRSS